MTFKHNNRESAEKGFVLVVVIWIVGLLAIIATMYGHSVKTHVRISSNVTQSAHAEALANGGAMLAVRDLLAHYNFSDQTRRFATNGTSTFCAISGEGRLAIRVQDESGKVDLNAAGLPLLQALLVGLGETPEFASTMAAAIMDYRDHDDSQRVNGAEQSDYVAARLPRGPKNARFESIFEIGQVLGADRALVAKLRPHVTVHSGSAGIDPRVSSKSLNTLIQRGMERATLSFSTFPELAETSPLPSMFTATSRRNAFSLHVTATNNSGAVFVRQAVVQLGPRRAPEYTFLTWQRGALANDDISSNQNSNTLPPC